VEAILDRREVIAKFGNPDQPRDDHGRWTSGGGFPNAVKYLRDHPGKTSKKGCARLVTEAFEKDGVYIKPEDRPHTGDAKDYGPALKKSGFSQVAAAGEGEGYPPTGESKEYRPQVGDVAVIQDVPGHPSGHMAMFNGKRWQPEYSQTSDREGFWPSHDYTNVKPRYAIYRHK
jgi:hypothetical protein